MLADVTKWYRVLSPSQAVILRDLMDRPFSTYQRLAEQLWGYEDGPEDELGNIKQHIAQLRTKLSPGWRVENIHRAGYRLAWRGRKKATRGLAPASPKTGDDK